MGKTLEDRHAVLRARRALDEAWLALATAGHVLSGMEEGRRADRLAEAVASLARDLGREDEEPL